MNTLRFALRGLWRDWRGGDLRLLALALALSVAAITSVGFFTDRVDKSLQRQGNVLLAADLVLESPQPLPEAFIGQARTLGLSIANTLTFPSVIVNDQGPQLVQVKAVDEAYPLRGQVLIRDSADSAVRSAASMPAPGQVWVESRLLTLLDAEIGETVRLGEKDFVVERLVALEPDRGGNLFQLAPRVLLNLADIADTGLVSPASRVRYRLLVAGEAATVKSFADWSEDHLPANAQTLTIADARPEFRAALERGGRFLGLAALVCVLVAGAAIALSAHRLVERQADAVAVMRCLGAHSRFLRNELLLRLALLLAICSLLGAVVGYAAQGVLAGMVGEWFAEDLPPPSLLPVLTALITAGVTVAGFALPALLGLPRVPPLRVLRRELGPPTAGPWLTGAAAFTVLVLLLFWQAQDARTAATVLAAATGLIALLGLAAFALVRLAAAMQSRTAGVGRFALASLSRHALTTGVQIGGFGLGMMAILLLAVVRLDLLTAWENTLPPEAPNRFLINILPEQADDMEAFLAQRQIAHSGLHPMIRGRLTTINGREVVPEEYENPRTRRLAIREFNLSWGTEPQADNRIVAGNWWSGDDPAPQLSVEQGIAEAFGIEVGDRLGFWVAGHEVSAPVSNIRTVQWDSFNVNFFVVGTPQLLSGEPATYITSFHLPAQREEVAVELIRRFPNATLLDVSALMQQVRSVMNQGSRALEYVFAFTLAAGLLVLFAGIQAGAESRQREAAILRTLGASRRQLLGAVALEFAVLGLLAGTLAALGANAAGYFLADQILELPYGFSPVLWFTALIGGAIGIGLAGLAATWPLVTRSPLASLRKHA